MGSECVTVRAIGALLGRESSEEECAHLWGEEGAPW
jgi:hypothetical protein